MATEDTPALLTGIEERPDYTTDTVDLDQTRNVYFDDIDEVLQDPNGYNAQQLLIAVGD